MNRAMLIGNLGKDPEVKLVTGNRTVANLRIATSRTWMDDGTRKEATEWHDVEVWGPLAESCGKYLAKGRQVFVEGRLQTDRWQHEGQDHTRTKIVASVVRFLGPAPAPADVAGEEPTE